MSTCVCIIGWEGFATKVNVYGVEVIRIYDKISCFVACVIRIKMQFLFDVIFYSNFYCTQVKIAQHNERMSGFDWGLVFSTGHPQRMAVNTYSCGHVKEEQNKESITAMHWGGVCN